MRREARNTSGGAPLRLSRRQDSGWSVVCVAGEVPLTTRGKLGAYPDGVTARSLPVSGTVDEGLAGGSRAAPPSGAVGCR
jgi:hypothetical protein